MADITTQKLGGTGTDMALGNGAIREYTMVIDVEQAVTDGFVAGENIQIMTLPAGSMFFGLQAEITEALVLGTTPIIDIGTTDADPDEYIDGVTTVTTGVMTDVTAALATASIATELELVCELNGSGVVSGKIAVTVWMGKPTIGNLEIASPREYPLG